MSKIIAEFFVFVDFDLHHTKPDSPLGVIQGWGLICQKATRGWGFIQGGKSAIISKNI